MICKWYVLDLYEQGYYLESQVTNLQVVKIFAISKYISKQKWIGFIILLSNCTVTQTPTDEILSVWLLNINVYYTSTFSTFN